MEMRVSGFDGATLVAFTGRLNTVGVGDIEARFIEAITPKARPTIVDLQEVDFLASVGIRMLISAARALAEKGARLALCNASPGVLEVIESTSLMEIIPLADSPAEALELIVS